MAIRGVIMACCNCLGYCWYPYKERLGDCCWGVRRHYRPHEDPAFPSYQTSEL